MKKIFPPLLFLFFFLSTACNATDVGNPPADLPEVPLQFTGVETLPVIEGALTLSTGLQINAAWLVLDSPKIYIVDSKGDCVQREELSEDDSIPEHDLIVTELISGQEWPSDLFVMEEERICRIDFNFSSATSEILPEEAPPELHDASLFIEGTLSDGRAFSVVASFNERLHLRASKEGFSLDNTPSLLLAFGLDQWFDEESIFSEGEEPILIEKGDRRLNEIRVAIKKSVRLLSDANSDGVLQEDELNSLLAEGSE